VCRELSAIGWSVHEYPVPGPWPRRDASSLAALAGVVERIPGDALVLLDGLIASTAPDVLVPQAARLRLVVLVHMPLGHWPAGEEGAGDTRMREREVLSAAAAVVTTSAWSRQRVLELYSLPADRVHVAEPGVESAEIATGSAAGGELLCVAAVRFDKGQDVLLGALEMISEESWRCVCVGSLDREPAFAESLRRTLSRDGLGERVDFAGPRTGRDLDRSYAAADLLVLPSRAETYGMVITEALARGLPVIATEVGGVSEALGHVAAGGRPGLLVPPEDPAALAAGLRDWLGDAGLRGRLRQAARERRESLTGWSTTAAVLAGALVGAAR
jgi:glycosyltransferase involved in cell wall biosynthesis